jgi:hypothetical protein
MKRDASRRLRLLVFSASVPCCDARLAEAVLDRNLAVLCLLVLGLGGIFGLEEVALDVSAALQSGVVAVAATAGLDVPWVMRRIMVVCNVQVSTAKVSSGDISQQ